MRRIRVKNEFNGNLTSSSDRSVDHFSLSGPWIPKIFSKMFSKSIAFDICKINKIVGKNSSDFNCYCLNCNEKQFQVGTGTDGVTQEFSC